MRSRSVSRKNRVAVSRLDQRRKLAIPKTICDQIGLREGSTVEITIQRGSALLKPRRVERDDILTPEEEKLVRRGEKQLREGKFVLWDDLKKRLKL